jgi:hypothetical protein
MPENSETGLSPAECRDLRRVAGLMIPPSEAFDVPGADDPAIFADIMQSVGRDLGEVRNALARLSVLAGRAFAELDEARGEAVAKALLAGGDRTAAALGRVILQCYYRDERVLRALGLDPGPPFPKGHIVEQGDWSLLDVVRDRAPLWHDDRGA